MSTGSKSGGLLSVLLLALMLDLGALAWVVYKSYSDRNALLAIRTALFTQTVDDRSAFQLSPENQPDSFMFDSEATKAAWLEQFGADVDYMDDVLLLEGDEIERAKAIVLLFSRNGSVEGCGEFRDLADTLGRIGQDNGYGCCSDHSQSFLALASLSGMNAREMIDTEHVFAEFYHPKTKQWVWIDPQYALMARNESGRYLSLLEVRDNFLEGRPPEFEFFGNEYHDLFGLDPHGHHYFNEASDFAVYSSAWGSNVFDQDAFNRRFGSLPIPVRQFLGLMTGDLPAFVTLSDGHSEYPEELQHQRRVILVVLVGLVSINLAAVSWLTFSWVSRGSRRSSLGQQ